MSFTQSMNRETIILTLRKPITNLILFILTFFTTTAMGLFQWSLSFYAAKGIINYNILNYSGNNIIKYYSQVLLENKFLMMEAIKYSLALLIFLLAHEFGHYLACKHHGVQATLPYLIPVPFAFGTMGAVIKMRGPIPNKKVLFDIGIAGPLAGFTVALPLLYYGIKNSFFINPISGGAIYFGEPIIWKIFHLLIFGSYSNGKELMAHPVAFASWFALLATALNLFPMGQLDGGHILYALLGRKAIIVFKVFFGFIVALVLIWPYWIVWVIIGWFLGLKHPPVLDETVPLGTDRKILSIIAALIFILCFIIIPIQYK